MNIVELLTEGVHAFQTGNILQAKNNYLQVLKVFPDNIDALNFMGVLECQIGNFSIAIDYLKKAVELAPQVSHLHNNLGNAFKANQELNLAQQSYQTAYHLDPTNQEAIHNLGVILKNQGHFEEALAIFKTIIPTCPDLFQAKLNLAEIWIEQKEYEQAIILLEPLSYEQKNNPFLFFHLGRAYFNTNQFDKAIEFYQKVIENNKGTLWEAEALFHQALCLLAKGDNQKAQGLFKNIEEKYPESLWSRQASERLKS